MTDNSTSRDDTALQGWRPSAAEIEMHILRFPEDADYVVQMPGRVPIDPEEIWIEGIGVWLRTDGSYASADRERGGTVFHGLERDQLARVVAYWKKFRPPPPTALNNKDEENG